MFVSGERERRVTGNDGFVSMFSFKREAARDSLDHLLRTHFTPESDFRSRT
jgi:hypothetical protein